MPSGRKRSDGCRGGPSTTRWRRRSSGIAPTDGGGSRCAPGKARPVRVLITGGAGQLGRDLAEVLGPSAFALDRSECDITKSDAVAAAVQRLHPEVIVNAGAWTDV